MIVSVLHPGARHAPGATAAVARRAADTGFYRAVEVAEVTDAHDRAELRRLVAERDLRLVYWVSVLQMESDRSICDPDEAGRAAAVAELVPHLAYAAECGAHAFAFLPGPDPGPAERPRALASLARSVRDLAAAGDREGITRLAMETMDREAHKKHVLGPIDETAAFVREVRADVPGFSLAFDSSHVRLLGEDPAAALPRVAPLTATLHLANCVPDPASPDFGDRHMPLGPPGFLDVATAGRIIRAALDSGVGDGALPIVTLEVAGPGGEGSWSVEREQRAFLQTVLAEMGYAS